MTQRAWPPNPLVGTLESHFDTLSIVSPLPWHPKFPDRRVRGVITWRRNKREFLWPTCESNGGW